MRLSLESRVITRDWAMGSMQLGAFNRSMQPRGRGGHAAAPLKKTTFRYAGVVPAECR